MKEVTEKSMTEGRTMDDAEGEEFDTISDEIKAIRKLINRIAKEQS